MAEYNEKAPKVEVKNLMPTAFTISGLAPTSSTFRLTPDQLKRETLAIAKTFLSDFTDCTLDHSNNGMLVAYLWLPQDSKHLTEQVGADSGTIIKKPIFRYSNEIREFMDKFCRKDNKRTFNEDRPSGGIPKVALEVDLMRFMEILFDTNGYQYSKVSNSRATRTSLMLRANFTKDGNKFGTFSYLTVEKSLQNNFVKTEPTPRKSYKL